MMVFTLLSRLLGIVKARAISAVFGGGALTDTINFSYNIPNSLRKLFAEGALTSSYLPLFSAESDNRETSSHLLSLIVNFQILVFIPLVGASVLFGRRTITFLSGFSEEWQIELAAGLLPFFTVFLFFISVASLFAAVLQSRRRFVLSSASPIVFSLAVIASLYLFSGRFGAYAMAIGTVSGAAAQALVCLFAMHGLGLKYKPVLDFGYPLFRKMLSAWLPATGTALIAVLSQQITYYFASLMEPGSLTAFSNAIIFYQTPYGIFFTAISGVYFPELSRARRDEKGKVLCRSLSYLYTLLLPSAIILAALGRECIAVVLQQGAFTLENTLLTYKVLLFYLPAMITSAFYSMLQRSCYASGNYNRALAVSVISSAVDVAATWILVKTGFGAPSISLAYLISSSVGFIILLSMEKGLSYIALIKDIIRISLVNLPLVILAALYMHMGFDFFTAGSTLHNAGMTLFFGVIFSLVVLISYIFFHVPFLEGLLRNKKRIHAE